MRDAMGQEVPPLSEQVPMNSASTGQGSPLPEAGHVRGSEWVLQMVLQVSDRWGTSTSPCHLPFPRSHFPASPHAASEAQVPGPEPAPGVPLTLQLGHPAPGTGGHHRQQRPLREPPAGLLATLSLTSLLSPDSFLARGVQRVHCDGSGR